MQLAEVIARPMALASCKRSCGKMAADPFIVFLKRAWG
jgi:hypothetical protein